MDKFFSFSSLLYDFIEENKVLCWLFVIPVSFYLLTVLFHVIKYFCSPSFDYDEKYCPHGQEGICKDCPFRDECEVFS